MKALDALNRWVGRRDTATRQKGRSYHRSGRVLSIRAASDTTLAAEVEGQELYETALTFADGQWTSTCSCPVGTSCKHAVAAALRWIDSAGADSDHSSAETSDAPTPKPKKLTFAEQWVPVLAEKLGRPLDRDERRTLDRLSRLFTDFTRNFQQVTPYALQAHGFSGAIPNARTWNHWDPIFKNWWPPVSPPRDPWALWQYIAYSLETNGHPIPEVLRPMTATEPVRAAVEDLLMKKQVALWQNALENGSEPDADEHKLANLGRIRVRILSAGTAIIEVQPMAGKPWKIPTRNWTTAIGEATLADLAGMSAAEAAIVTALLVESRGYHYYQPREGLEPEVLAAILATKTAYPAIVLEDERPFVLESEPLAIESVVDQEARNWLRLRLVTPDGQVATGAVPIKNTGSPPLYLFAGRVWPGPPPLPSDRLPIAVLHNSAVLRRLRAVGLRLPDTLELKSRTVRLEARLQLSLHGSDGASEALVAELRAHSPDPKCEQQWTGHGWFWVSGAEPPPRGPNDALLEFDRSAAEAVGAKFGDFRFGWDGWLHRWRRSVTRTFPEEFAAWLAALPAEVKIEVSPELAGFLREPERATIDFSALPADSGRDWFDITVALRVEDTTLAPDEVALLLKARGKWVRLPKGGWRRLQLGESAVGDEVLATLDRLGLGADDVLTQGAPVRHRLHALQLAGEAAALEKRDATLATALRERVDAIKALPPPATPAGLTAVLRRYQEEGYHFLAHLSQHGFGGVLADDMGLGKTVQALAWLLHLADTQSQRGATKKTRAAFRALVVCPKSVVHGWLGETARFAPSLRAQAFTPELTTAEPAKLACQLLVANYSQLRLHAEWFRSGAWDAVILDEGQFIKNPTSQIAAAARELPSRHRLVLTGTPVENRLTDLWSLFAFAQPGLLGTQAAFRRHYNEKDPAALARLHRRVRHFLLRRTKAQAAPDLPPRTEDDLVVELEPAQRKLYDAELKRARAQLLGVKTARELDKVRFNILASLLRLRQICCHPALLDPAHAALPSAKLDALMERLEELRDEGHQVLVFSQFVEMLELIRSRLNEAQILHLLLTGQTEDRAALVEKFQADRSQTVFLLSLRAAGFGLNLTAASYAILFDPWWNPAVETQAIDRTHRIGQTKPVIAYRLLARDTIEQKIRALQQEKAALASAVVQEESLASVLDLESLRRILE